jgi:predicted HD phosphohydrolase
LQLQGGIHTAAQAQAFIAQPGAQDAVRLRRWDDQAKQAGRPTPELSHFLHHVRRCALSD